MFDTISSKCGAPSTTSDWILFKPTTSISNPHSTNISLGNLPFSFSAINNLLNSSVYVIPFSLDFLTYLFLDYNVNSDLSSFNSALSALINTQLNLSLQKAEDYLTLREKLNIPLELNKNAPNIKPIRLKKIKKNDKLPFQNG